MQREHLNFLNISAITVDFPRLFYIVVSLQFWLVYYSSAFNIEKFYVVTTIILIQSLNWTYLIELIEIFYPVPLREKYMRGLADFIMNQLQQKASNHALIV